MKILAFVDLHGSAKALERIRAQSKQADIIVCAGDISIFENNLDKLLGELDKLKKPVLIIPGNHEEDPDLNQLTKMFDNITDIHKKTFEKENCLFLGYGGSGFSIVDKEFIKTSKKFEKEIKKLSNKSEKGFRSEASKPFRKSKAFSKSLGKSKTFQKHRDKKTILVTHAPPYKTKLDDIDGEACGNKSIKNFILKIKPDLVISGHLHENSGKEDKIRNTKLINPGPLGKIINI